MSKVALAGYGVEGQAAYRYFSARGDTITIFDEKPVEAPQGVAVKHGPTIFEDMYGYDLVVRTPGLRPDRIKTDAPITSITKEFFKRCPAPIIGITGSKGKGTTSTLIYKMLQAAGKTAHLVGNIGNPALDELHAVAPTDVVVYELSSFQLWDMEQSPHIAVVLMVEPEHLDVHTDVQEYYDAKARIVEYQTPSDVTVYLPSNPLTTGIALRGTGKKIPYTEAPGAHLEDGRIVMGDKQIIQTADILLPGQHNVDNACAAITAMWQIAQDVEAIASVLRTFDGLEHRLKLVATKGGVSYYDDSIATTPGSAIAALRAFHEPKIIILGGSDKGADFTELAREVARQDVKAAILIGAMRGRLQAALTAVGFTHNELFDETTTMQQIVVKAHELAQSGDVVILSPACASFDMFKNYKDRGEQFIAAANQLPN